MSDEITPSQVPVAVLEYEPSAFETALIKHKSKLILVGVLAVAGTIGYWSYRLYTEATHKSAAVAFTRAQNVEDLKKVASSHAGKPAAGNASILAAEYLSTDRPAEAVALLREFLSKTPNHPLADLAAFRIAEYSTAAGDAATAEKEYESVAGTKSPYAAFALLRLGDLKWGAGDSAKAKEYYDRILTNGAMAGSPARNAAQSRVEKSIKAKAPELVDYVPEPPPAPTPGAANSPSATTGLNGESDALLPAPALPQIPAAPEPAPAAPAETPAAPAAPAAPAETPAAPAAPAEAPPPAPKK